VATFLEDQVMERNDDFNGQNAGLGGASGSGSTGAGSSSFGAGSTGGSDLGGTGGAFGASGTAGSIGSTGGYGSSGTIGSSGGGSDFGQGSGGAGQGGQSKFQQAKGVAADKLGTVKEKVGNLNTSLADKLEAGAEKLRQRTNVGAQQFAGAPGTGSVTAPDERMVQYQNQLAKGLDSTADFLRNGDIKASVEEQVRTNPGRTLLIALGVGYVLGKAFRR